MDAFREESPEAPAIEVQLLDKGVRDATGEYILAKSGRRKEYPAEDMRRWEAYEIAQRIKNWVSEQRPVFDKNSRNWRGMKYGDIAILFSSDVKCDALRRCIQVSRDPFPDRGRTRLL